MKIITRDLSNFMGWMDGEEVEFKKLMKEAEEEEVKKWNRSIILKN